MATALTATDIFQFYEKSGAKMSERMKAILVNPNAATILNEKLEDTLNRFGSTFKEPVALKALMAVRNRDLVLFYAKPEYNLPDCIPFFRYVKGQSIAKVAVNMTNICTVDGDVNDPNSLTYNVDDMRKLYAMLVSAYIQLRIPDAATYPIKAIEFGCIMWARMFCKVLNRTIGLSTNKERYEAYFYFAARYYLKYLVSVPEATVDSITNALLRSGTKTPLIMMIEQKVQEQKINMYQDFTTFCYTLFSNDMSNIKGLRMVAASPNEKLNTTFYLKRFVDTYQQAAIFSLACLPYFTWMVICAQKKAYMMNIKMLGDVFDANEGNRYLAALYNEATN